MMTKYVESNEGGLFDKAARLEELHGMGDPLARLDQVIDWTLFEPVFARIPRAEPRGPGGRPPYRPLLMFKALVIQNLYQLSDAQFEFQITDRLRACFKMRGTPVNVLPPVSKWADESDRLSDRSH